jgi:hypothetical protein
MPRLAISTFCSDIAYPRYSASRSAASTPRRLTASVAGRFSSTRSGVVESSGTRRPSIPQRKRGWLSWDRMTTAEPMTARGAHYTALLETIDNQGTTKLHAREREQLLEAADALLFAEPENRRLLRSAEELIESLEASERWSAETCDQLREHLYGCDAPADVA